MMHLFYLKRLFAGSGLLLVLFLMSNSLFAVVRTISVGGADGMSFVPASGVTLNPGDTVKWVWEEGMHTTTSTTIPAGATGWNADITSSNTVFIYVPVFPGIYNYVCMPHESMGMTGSFTVTCVPPVKPVISPVGSVTGCTGDSASLLTVAADGVTFQWNLNGNPVTDATEKHYLPESSGTYNCTITNDCGSATSDDVVVTLYPVPEPSFTFTRTGLNYSFTNTTAGNNLQWLWDFGDGASSEEQHPQHTYTEEGIYTVSLSATDTVENDCAAEAKQEINTNETGINPVLVENNYSISPNPASSIITITGNTEHAMIKLYDLTGRMMALPAAVHRNNSGATLDISGLPAGNYLLQVITKEAAVARKILISK